jgi:hypothetical protein
VSFEGEDEGITRLDGQYDMMCYQGDHKFWVTLVGLPNGVLVVLALPISAYLKLRRANKEGMLFRNLKTYATFSVFYEGLRRNFWWWEIFSLSRKVSVMLIAVFLLPSVSGGNIQGIMALFFISCAICIHIKVNPFVDYHMNNIELFGLLASAMTIYFGLLSEYFSGEFVPTLLLVIATYSIHGIWAMYVGWIMYRVNYGQLVLAMENAKVKKEKLLNFIKSGRSKSALLASPSFRSSELSIKKNLSVGSSSPETSRKVTSLDAIREASQAEKAEIIYE